MLNVLQINVSFLLNGFRNTQSEHVSATSCSVEPIASENKTTALILRGMRGVFPASERLFLHCGWWMLSSCTNCLFTVQSRQYIFSTALQVGVKPPAASEKKPV